MKSLALSAVALAASLSATLADINVVSPWSDSAWKSGGNGTITWNITPEEENMKCEIQLLNGDTANSNIVAYVTDPGAPVPCSDKAFNIEPLNDFAKGKYWIRIGHPGEKKWFYSHAFEFDGKGTAEPLVLAGMDIPMPASSVSKPTAIPTAAVSSSAALKTASSAAGSAKFTLSSKSGGAGTHATAGPASENNKEANAKSAESSAAAAGKQQSTWMLALAGVAAVAAYSF
ncbi:hypothetical protein VTP01DRAFT_7703 [Rhizomucor pusillus]|uniref:uncharacterized protein n=1 Tax=Rhizomucor pusillus TaxID=4840 RepID=UPI0037442F0E